MKTSEPESLFHKVPSLQPTVLLSKTLTQVFPVNFHKFLKTFSQNTSRRLLSQVLLFINPPLKNTTPLFLAKPPFNLETVQAPTFRQFPLLVGFS